MLDLSKVCDLKIEDIDHRDSPDYCNAYISEAWLDDEGKLRELTQEELNWLNDQDEYRYQQIMKWIY
jgi:hypothetical protein